MMACVFVFLTLFSGRSRPKGEAIRDRFMQSLNENWRGQGYEVTARDDDYAKELLDLKIHFVSMLLLSR